MPASTLRVRLVGPQDAVSRQLGELFPERIRHGVDECRLLLALIGPDWLTARADGAPAGASRRYDPNDFVRQEIAQALAATGGNRVAAARLLGMSRAALYDRLARWPGLIPAGGPGVGRTSTG